MFFLEPDEIGINACLILQNMLDVTVTAVHNKREHQSSEGICGNWFLIIVIQHLPQDEKTNITLLTCVMIYMTLLFLL